jgi:hypothetical protein
LARAVFDGALVVAAQAMVASDMDNVATSTIHALRQRCAHVMKGTPLGPSVAAVSVLTNANEDQEELLALMIDYVYRAASMRKQKQLEWGSSKESESKGDLIPPNLSAYAVHIQPTTVDVQAVSQYAKLAMPVHASGTAPVTTTSAVATYHATLGRRLSMGDGSEVSADKVQQELFDTLGTTELSLDSKSDSSDKSGNISRPPRRGKMVMLSRGRSEKSEQLPVRDLQLRDTSVAIQRALRMPPPPPNLGALRPDTVSSAAFYCSPRDEFIGLWSPFHLLREKEGGGEGRAFCC